MSVINSIRSQLSPIHPQGYPFIGGFALASLVLFLLWAPLGWLGTVATLWCAYFFRDPPRVTPVRDGIVVAPADGRVSQIASAVPPRELELGDRPLPRVSIFMSVFDCHVNRSPVSGRIERVVYRAGKFLSADLDKASEDNERNAFVIATAGARIGVIQIAGLVARRIVPFAREGELVAAGQRIGMIRFGSRVDVYLPEGARALAAEGQTAIAGETVLADLRAVDAGRTFRVSLRSRLTELSRRMAGAVRSGYSWHMVTPKPGFRRPRLSRLQQQRLRRIPVRTLVPNVITLLALCAGLTAIRMAFEDRYVLALGAIVFAAILDGIDGRLARLLKGTSRFGAELDSLSDFVNFGVAPSLILYFWGLHELKSAGWIAAMVFAICAGLRLARFNVMIDDPDRPAWTANFFVGMPAPAGAITVLLPIYAAFLGLPRSPVLTWLTLLYTLAIALLMVSRLPVFSGKRVGTRVPTEMVGPVILLVILSVALLIAYPWVLLTAATLAYLGSLPFGYLSYRRYEQRSLEAQGGTGNGRRRANVACRARFCAAIRKPRSSIAP